MATCIGPVCVYPKSVCIGKRCVKRDISKEKLGAGTIAFGGIVAAGILTQVKVANKVVTGALPIDVIESSKMDTISHDGDLHQPLADEVPFSRLIDWSHGMFWMPDEWQELSIGPIN
jgi:hypothetical protein